MRNYIGYIIDYSDGELSDSKRKWFEYEMIRNKSLMENYELFINIKNSMRGRFDLEEVKNDPELPKMNLLASQMILEYNQNSIKNEKDFDFVSNALLSIENSSELNASNDPDLNNITKQWVDEWNNKDHSTDKNIIERKKFIGSALEDTQHQQKNSSNKSLTLRIIGLAAAALVAILLIIKSLVPSSEPNSLFQEYYKPLNAFTSTTRGSEKQIDNFSDAVEKYNQGEYQQASVMFSELISIDQNTIKYKFFSGITQLQLGNYQLAIDQLNQVLSSNDEFTKDAQWYLGLAYLKIGETDKAALQFKKLSEAKGYYQKYAQDLLERLK